MLKTTRKRTAINPKKIEQSKTVPNRAMSIKEIVARYVKGIPVDVVHRDPVYIDQTDHDLEQVSRMEFGDKAAMADELRLKAEQMQQQVRDERTQRARNAQAAKLAKAQGPKQKGKVQDLDNTLPDDTNIDNQ